MNKRQQRGSLGGLMTADLVSLVILMLLAKLVDVAYGTLDPVDQVLINVSDKLSGFEETIYVCRFGAPKREHLEGLVERCNIKNANGRRPVYMDFDQGVIRLDTTFGANKRFVEPGSAAIYLNRLTEVIREEAERLKGEGFLDKELKKWKLSEIVVEGHASHKVRPDKGRPRPPPDFDTVQELFDYAKKEFGSKFWKNNPPSEKKGREAILNWIREMHLKDENMGGYDDNVRLAMGRARGVAEMLSGTAEVPVLVASYGCHRPLRPLNEVDRGKPKTDPACFAKDKDDAYPLIYLEPQAVDPKEVDPKAESNIGPNRRIEIRFNFRIGASKNV